MNKNCKLPLLLIALIACQLSLTWRLQFNDRAVDKARLTMHENAWLLKKAQSYAVDRNDTVMFTFSNRPNTTDVAWQITTQYCEKWRYRCQRSSSRLLNASFGYNWERYAYLEKIFKDTGVYAAVWLDADSFVYDFDMPIDAWLEKYPSQDVIISNHERWNDRMSRYGFSPNTGVMIFRNTPFVQYLLRFMLEAADCQYFRNGSDQACLRVLPAKNASFLSHFGIVPAHKFNCQATHQHYVGGYCDPWVFHTMGSKKCLAPVGKKFLEMGCSKINFHQVCASSWVRYYWHAYIPEGIATWVHNVIGPWLEVHKV